MVDKNVPLNRLGLKSQDWLIEPDLEGLTDNFKPLHLSKNKGWRVGAGKSAPALIMIPPILFIKMPFRKTKRGAPIFARPPRAFELKELIQKFAFQTFCPQNRHIARISRGGSEMRLRYSLKIKQSLFPKSFGAPLVAHTHQNFYDMLPFKKKIFAPPLTYIKNHFFENRLGTLINFTESPQDFALRGGSP